MHDIPGYSGLEQIGVGGTATVYRADCEGRTVAVKVLTAPTVDERAHKQFTRESGALRTLGSHPNIVVLHDVGTTAGGRPYIAMEHLPGGSLADRGPLPAPQAVTIAVAVADALHTAHTEGVLHRDVKPANVLLDADGHPKLADFGISGLVDATHTTGGGMTLNHVAPEVVDGGTATIRSDVYSLASTTFELLAGTPPFTVEAHAAMVTLLLKVLDDPVPDLRPLGVPDDLAAVLEGALAKDPAARPATAADLGRQLAAVQTAHGWTAGPTAPPPAAPPPRDEGLHTLPMDGALPTGLPPPPDPQR